MLRKMLVITAVALVLILAACTVRAAEPKSTPVVVSHGSEFGGLVELVDAFRDAGATVEPAGQVEQPFFGVIGWIIKVNDADVQVFEYPDEEIRRAESERISPEGSAIGTSMVTWVDQPNFWAQGRVIVLYVGHDAVTLDLLATVLGDPITSHTE